MTMRDNHSEQKEPGEPLEILYHLGRMTWPDLPLSAAEFNRQAARALELGRIREGAPVSAGQWIAKLRLRDWWLAVACAQEEGQAVRERAWTRLVAGTVPATGRLLTDSLMEKARLVYREDEEARDRAVAGFWGLLLAGGQESTRGPLYRYDGTSPLIPWILTVFHNHLVDEARKRPRELGEVPPETPLPDRLELPEAVVRRFEVRARDWLAGISDREAVVLALIWRHGLSQRQAAELLGKHESNVSRDLRRMREAFHAMTEDLVDGDELAVGLNQADAWRACLLREMGHVLGEDPRLAAVRLSRTLDGTLEKPVVTP